MTTDEFIKTWIRTSDERDVFLSELDVLLESVYETKNKNIKEVLLKKVRKPVSDFIHDQLPIAAKEQESLLLDIKKTVTGLPKTHLRLAYVPSSTQLQDLYEKVAEVIGPAVLEIEYDPSIIGGVVVYNEGKYIDLTVSNAIEAQFNDQKTALWKILNTT